MSMIVDNIWPDDFVGSKSGKPRYKDVSEYARQRGFSFISEDVGFKYAKRLRVYTRMKESARQVSNAMKAKSGVKSIETQMAAAELLTCMIIVYSTEVENLTPEELKDLTTAVRKCNWVVIQADKHAKKQMLEGLKKAKKNIEGMAKKKQLDPETLRVIRRDVFGIIDEQLGTRRHFGWRTTPQLCLRFLKCG